MNFRLGHFGRGFFCAYSRHDASYVISGEHVALTKNTQVLPHTTTHRHVHAALATWLTPIETSYIIRSEA